MKHGHPRFYALLEEIATIHASKNQDYASGSDPLANFKMAAAIGIAPWLGCLIRMGDKFSRLESFAAKRKLNNEGFEDTLKDLAIYSLLCLILYEEEGVYGSYPHPMGNIG